MRQNAFGDYRIDSPNDDLGAVIDNFDVEHSHVYATVYQDELKDKWSFEVLTSDEGEEIAASDVIFESAEAARNYLEQWLDPDTIEVC